MYVNESRTDDLPRSVDRLRTRSPDRADLDDPVTRDGNVRIHGRRARTVDHASASYDYIVILSDRTSVQHERQTADRRAGARQSGAPEKGTSGPIHAFFSR